MINRPSRLRRAACALSALVAIGTLAATAAPGGEQPAGPARAATGEKAYLDENRAAMTRMMAAMDVAPTGDVDRDFVAMMIPHHQGAIDMAQAVLRHGMNETVRRLAQEIVVTQCDEIAAMRLAIGDPPARPSH